MSDSKKTWVIGITDDLDIKSNIAEQPTPTTTRNRPMIRPALSRPAPRPQPKPVVKQPPAKRMHYALLVTLTYLMGPFALMLTERGRMGRAWLVSGSVAGLVGLGMMVWRSAIQAGVESGFGVVILGMITIVVLMTGFSAWARALVLTRDPDPAARAARRQGFPDFLRKPWVLGGLGFLVPGLGLLLAGRARRAAAVLWSCQLGVVAGLVMLHAPWIWQVNGRSSIEALDPNRLEVFFLGSALACLLFGLVWIGQAMESGRQAARTRGSSHSPRGDLYALALLASLAVLAVTADPVKIAEDLDAQGQIMQQSGYRVIPLKLSLAAHRCDPSRARYAIQAVDLYAELGQEEKAFELRDRLDENLGSFVELVMLEGPVREGPNEVLYAQSAPATDSVSDVNPTSDEGVTSEDDPAQGPAEGENSQPNRIVDAAFPGVFFGAMLIPDPE